MGRTCSQAIGHRSLVWALAMGASPLLAPAAAFAQNQSTTDATTGLEEIIVTAQRREESLQDVPISVSAIGGDTLAAAGVIGSTGISQVVPSVQMTQSGPGAIFFIRGVGNSSGGVGEEGANAFYIDGVYLGDLTSAATKFNNIARIEVLKGPQGTLFGRNSSGGLVHIITREPDDETVFNAKIGGANYKTAQAQLYTAAPVTQNLSMDVAITAKQQIDGFGRNLATNKDVQRGWYWGARSKLVYRPGDATKIVVSGDYYQDHNDYQNGFNLIEGSIGFGGYRYPGDYNLKTTDPAYAKIKSWGTALTVEHQFGATTLTSITARRSVEVDSQFDADYTPTPLVHAVVPSRVRTFQQELRLASATTAPFNWQVGLFYYNAIANVDGFKLTGAAFGGPDRGTSIVNRMETNSYAAFGEAGYAITPTTQIIAGLRYTKDKRDLHGSVTTLQTGAVFAPAGQALSTGKLTYRVALRQELTDKVNIYASYNRGFKSGIFATTSSPADPPVKPQTIDAFEVGLKSQLFDNMVRFNLAGFHYTIDDYQVRASPAPGRTLLLNAASVKVDGVEGELAIAPARGLQFNLIATYLNSRFSSFPGALFNYPNPAVCNALGTREPGMTTGAPTGGGMYCVGDATGKRTPLSPRFASSAGVTYRTPVGDQGEVIVNGLWSYNGTIYFEADNRLKQSAYSVFNASIEYRPSPNWGVEVWGNNLSDARYLYTGVAGTTGDHGEIAAPRTYGVNLKFDF